METPISNGHSGFYPPELPGEIGVFASEKTPAGSNNPSPASFSLSEGTGFPAPVRDNR
jgi:hypothetical protein